MSNLQGTEYPMGTVMEIMGMELQAAGEGNVSLVPVIVGDPGIGKSASLRNLAKKLNMDIIIISVGATPMEFWSGLPEFGSMEVGIELTVDGSSMAKTTEWTMSDVIRTINANTIKALDNGKEGLLVLLDDLHLTEVAIQKYLFEFLQNKTLQNYKIHPSAYLAGAMNGKDSAGLEGFLSAILNRLALYNVKFDMDYWYQNVGYSLHPYVASFASQSANFKYFNGGNSTDSASPSARTWTELSIFIYSLEDQLQTKKPQDINEMLQIAAEARVGREAQVEFMKHVKLFQKFDFHRVFAKKEPGLKIPTDISDQVMSAFIIRYVKNEADAEYLVKDVINGNYQQRTFISVLIQELATLHNSMMDMENGPGKKGLQKIAELLTDPDSVAVPSDILDRVIESFMDIK